MARMRFTTTLEQHGRTATGLEVPDDVVMVLGSGKRPAVRVTINGHTWRSSVAVMGGRNLVGVSAENRSAAGVSAGDVLEVDLELDTEKREVEVPADLVAALKDNAKARAAFDALSYSNKSRYVLAINGAKAAETRARRIAKTVEELSR
jgi:hypothetical protein